MRRARPRQVIEVHRLEATGNALAQRATGDDEVRSAVVGGAPRCAGRIFPRPLLLRSRVLHYRHVPSP